MQRVYRQCDGGPCTPYWTSMANALQLQVHTPITIAHVVAWQKFDLFLLVYRQILDFALFVWSTVLEKVLPPHSSLSPLFHHHSFILALWDVPCTVESLRRKWNRVYALTHMLACCSCISWREVFGATACTGGLMACEQLLVSLTGAQTLVV